MTITKDLTTSYTIHEIDYNELRDFVYRAFEDFCGKEVVSYVEVEHFNPSIIDITVYVAQKKNNEMRQYAAELSNLLNGRGISAAVSVKELS